jgi:GNAT superfamily N-acetyltransferase
MAHKLMGSLIIRPFLPIDQEAARVLILAGLKEHWGYLDETRNLDLEDIASSCADGIFLVASLDGVIVGTGGYLPRSETEIEVVRMSVAKEMRRQGIGKQILTELCHFAGFAGFQRAILETTRTWNEVIQFYKGFGFEFTHFDGDDAYFSLML